MSYVMENVFTKDGKIYRAKFKKWCVTNSIPIPRAKSITRMWKTNLISHIILQKNMY